MSTPRATVCKQCGAPRDTALPYAMCRDCYNDYQIAFSSKYRRKKGVPEAKRLAVRCDSSQHELKRAYERLGLSVGNVWKLVLR